MLFAELTSAVPALRPMVESDLRQVLAWRNDRRVRRHMFDREEIAWANHVAWFKKATADQCRHILIFEASGVPAGYLGFSESKNGANAEWGFYTAQTAPKGYGTLLCATGLNYGFLELGLHKIIGRVIASNRASIALHGKLGFALEGTLREAYFDGNGYRDVLCFGLLNREWQEKTC